ncbi:MAG: translation initiation factor 2 [Oscillospiraceae bacterium]|jgi:hypothetical protein|nr:translation initiation factor 2 [Oscillospiraceae bacterium]
MVKGTARRVIIVKPPNKKLFEEAVFFLRQDSEIGVSGDEIIAEAQAVANSFMRESVKTPRFRHLRTVLLLALGAAAASAVWAITVFAF